MTTIHEHRIRSLTMLINWLDTYLVLPSNTIPDEYALIDATVKEAHVYNPWFIELFNRASLRDFSNWVKENIEDLKNITRFIENTEGERKVALLISPDIPLCGAQELVILYLAGCKVILHNKDHKNDLLLYLTQKLFSFFPNMDKTIQWTDFYPRDIDGWVLYDRPYQRAIHQYFDKRNSLFIPDFKQFVVLNGYETSERMNEIVDSIFIYWGFSSNNVRKVYVPLGYNFNIFFEALERYNFLYQHNCYANNYDYHKSVLLMNRIPFLDNGFIILREDASDNVPIGCLHYSYYTNEGEYDQLSHLAIETKNRIGRQSIDLVVNYIKSFKEGLH